MNRHFYKTRAAALRALAGRPCEWDGCGQPSSHWAYNGTQIRPLCATHAHTAGVVGHDVHAIPALEKPAVFPHPDDKDGDI